MAQESLKSTKAEERLRQLIGEWIIGVAMKTREGKVAAGCGEMIAERTESGINCEIDSHIEGYEDYYQNDLWTFDPADEAVHLFRLSSDGQPQDHTGKWLDDSTIELYWRGTFEDQEQEEHITIKWVTKDQFEIKEKNYSKGKLLLTTDYVFKRKALSEQTQQNPSQFIDGRLHFGA
ncbi:MAG: hypothetical protein LBI79_09345 [Nitrososphaerota archaeon]|nr:hypothetical protein [Nitrososphaerota archaeon]